MTLDRIKTFLRCFHAAVKQKITCPGAREIAPEILAGLRQASRFDIVPVHEGHDAPVAAKRFALCSQEG